MCSAFFTCKTCFGPPEPGSKIVLGHTLPGHLLKTTLPECTWVAHPEFLRCNGLLLEQGQSIQSHTPTLARTHACTHARQHARKHDNMHVRTHACKHARTHARMHARNTHARTHARKHAGKTQTRTHVRTHAPIHPNNRMLFCQLLDERSSSATACFSFLTFGRLICFG